MRDSAADVAIAERVLDGEPAGYTELYDRYAGQLYAYCYNMLGGQEQAVGALGMTFMIAVCRLGQLPDSDRLRPWLYALARNECRRYRRNGRAGSSPVVFAPPNLSADQQAELPQDGGRGGWASWAEDGELLAAARFSSAETLAAGMRTLSLRDREAVELCLRHNLIGPDLSDVLGIPVGRVHKVITRAWARLQRTLRTLLVARWGREDCPDLDGMLASWDGQPTAMVRRRVRRHMGVCDSCRAREWRELPSGALAGLLAEAPQPAPPPGLRDQVLRLLAEIAHGTPTEGDLILELVARRAGSFGSSGFPAVSRQGGKWRTDQGLWVAAAAVAVAVAGVVTILSGVIAGGA
ncbi:MAG TPA: sigma-70 family RNA polymerase sigma factor [Streptosporangiaceae bacterium]|nr:sigma-70 family RNA polymerase sigma factor [Streptosporangiaceae bacterium]